LPRGPGVVAWAGHRAQPSDPPARATEQGRPASGTPRCSYEATPAIPHRGTPARDPHAPALWLLPPAGRYSPPPSRSPWSCLKGLSSVFGRGKRSARRVPAAMPPSAAGTQRGDRDGVSVTLSHADTEGPRHRTRYWVAVEEVSERSERGRASAERPRTRLAKENSTEGTKEPHPATRGAGTTWPHTVKEERIGPRGKTKASRSGKEKGPEGPGVQEERSDYTQPRSFIAVATRSMATIYAALRM
jgi:hypothetical protein